MTSFSTLLTTFIDQKNISIHPLTRYCNLDRSTMYKYLNGKRLPPKQELVERIADYMRLSPSEHEDLITAWTIAQIGEKTYYNRKNVENFILNFPDVTKIDPLTLSSYTGIGSTDCPACKALTSQAVINDALSRMILAESEKKKGRLALLLQPDNDYLFHFLTGLGEAECTLSIEQILCLNNSGQPENSSGSFNLRYLQKILPLYIRALDYHIYYYYDRVESHFSGFNGLSCLILTGSAALACTSDFQTGIFYSQPETVELLWKLFQDYKEKCTLLFHPFRSLSDELNMLQNIGQDADVSYCIQPEPCLVPFITPDLVEKYIRPDLPDRDALISTLNSYLDQRGKAILSENFHIYHTQKGIRSFLDTGKIYEIPEGICLPFAPEDRTLLITRLLKESCGNYQLLQGPLQYLPHNFHLFVTASGGYLLFSNRLNQTIYLLFDEPGLLASFLDYLEHLDVKYLCSDHETKAFIQKLL